MNFLFKFIEKVISSLHIKRKMSSNQNKESIKSAFRPYRVIVSTGYDLTGKFNDNHNMVAVDFPSENEYQRVHSQTKGEQLHSFAMVKRTEIYKFN